MTESSTDMSFQYPYRINNIRKGGATSIDKKYRTFQYPYGINILERVPPANTCSYGVKFQGSANLPFWGV